MYIRLPLKRSLALIVSIILVFTVGAFSFYFYHHSESELAAAQEGGFIKWVDFTVPYNIMEKTMKLDIASQSQEVKLNWIELMAYLSSQNGGKYGKNSEKELNAIVERLRNGEKMEDITKEAKYYAYYYEAYDAIFHEFLGDYRVEKKDESAPEGKSWEEQYGLKVFSPIAKKYPFSHYEDFGSSRSYGYARKHLGNDLLGSVGTPIIAVEGGTVEALGWNMYGGWRIGIRSFDKKRYYYYAHLRQNFPYHKSLQEGMTVKAGDVIGYLGRSGYSTNENTNNIEVPHLHFGMQLIFDESQKEGSNEIWIDVYNIVNLLQKNKSEVVKNPETKDYSRVYDFEDLSAKEGE